VHHLDGFGVRQIEIPSTSGQSDVMQLFTLLSWPGKFQVLDGHHNKKQEI